MFVFGVCDDDPNYAKYISDIIREYCNNREFKKINIKIAPIFTSGYDVLDYLKNNAIDVLFLDLIMPNISGFEIAEEIVTHHSNTTIIFVSAYEEMVYKSFEYNPFRFIRKSHIEDELLNTIDSILKKLVYSDKALKIHSTIGDFIIRKTDIIYIESQKNYQLFSTIKKNTYKCRGTLLYFENLLKNDGFFRIHSSFLINMNYIDGLLSCGKIILKNGITISISRNKLSIFNETYSNFLKDNHIY